MTLRAKRILVADDEPYMHRLMRHHLLRAGYQMLSAHHGGEAVAKSLSEAPDLIIMDIMMAEIDGLTALNQLKANAQTREIPVIILTASAHGAARVAFESGGAAAYFTKPFSPTQLLAEIKRLLPEPVTT